MTTPGDAGSLSVALSERRLEFLRFVQKRVGDAATAEDILQDALSRSLTAGDELRDPNAAIAWFYRLLRNRIVDHHRRAGAEARRLAALQHEPLDAADTSVEPAAMSSSGKTRSELTRIAGRRMVNT